MLRAFGFVLHVEHPHKFVLSLLLLLGFDGPILQEAWNLTNDRCDALVAALTRLLCTWSWCRMAPQLALVPMTGFAAMLATSRCCELVHSTAQHSSSAIDVLIFFSCMHFINHMFAGCLISAYLSSPMWVLQDFVSVM
jgi:hypothetical protein